MNETWTWWETYELVRGFLLEGERWAEGEGDEAVAMKREILKEGVLSRADHLAQEQLIATHVLAVCTLMAAGKDWEGYWDKHKGSEEREAEARLAEENFQAWAKKRANAEPPKVDG